MFAQAQAYERFMGRWSRMLADLFVPFAGLTHSQRVLDVGSGTGSLARAIVAAAPSAHVVGIDSSPGFVEYASTELGGRAHFEVADAQRLPFADNVFDACCSILVLNFIADQGKALAEMRRVTKDGGTIAAAVWDHAEGMHMLKLFWEVADAVDPNKRIVEEPQPLLSRDGLVDLWRNAGFRDVKSEALTFDMRFESFADYWQPFELSQGPAGVYLSGVSPQVRDTIERELRERLLDGTADRPFTLSTRAWAVRGNV
ncbi:MAG: methyltransferase domain-containing protein [Candidatus Eremiobacteraeota bacterium]|nr:methyltransferase domain-containing protein [Candidatus Eremiobacteraeota bacterium]